MKVFEILEMAASKLGMFSILVLSAIASSQSRNASPIPAPAPQSSTHELTQARSLHQALVSAIDGGHSIDDQLTAPFLQTFPKNLTTREIRIRGEQKPERVPLNFKQALARTEDILKNSGLRVRISIQATPGHCNIKYRPVIGGADLDAGETNLSVDLDPRWYIFSCDCSVPSVERRVDCTQNKSIVFQCK